MGKLEPTLHPDSQLGPYRIVRLIGLGGMGEVYEAIDNSLHRRVALKIISPALMGDINNLKRFQIEGKALAQLNHKNIVTVYSLGVEDGTHFMVMELLEGQGLHEIIGSGNLSSSLILSLLIQILEGVRALHATGIIHRDLKPSNIIVTNNQIVKIVDLGIARAHLLVESDSTTTKSGALIGSISYLAPEIVMGQVATVQSDMWAVGMILYEMIFRKKAFSGNKNLEIIEEIKSKKIRVPKDRRPDISKKIFEILDWLLEKDPHRRAPSAEIVLRQLESSSPILTRPEFDLEFDTPRSDKPRMSRILVWALASLVIGLIWFSSNKVKFLAIPNATSVKSVTLGSPAKGEQIWLKSNDGVRFEWSQPSEMKISLQVAADPRFTKDLVNLDQVTSPYFLQNLKHDEPYYWRLKSQQPDGSTTFSETRSFFLGALSPPTPLSPPSGALIAPRQYTIMTWQAKPYVVSYRLQIATDQQFSKIVKDFNVAGTRYELPYDKPYLNEGKYFWRIAALENTHLANLWSEGREINVLPEELSDPTPVEPKLTKSMRKDSHRHLSRKLASNPLVSAPEVINQQEHYLVRYSRPLSFRNPASVREAIINPPIFRWKASGNSSAYKIQIAKSDDFSSSRVFVQKTVRALFYKWTTAKPGTYFWRIRSLNGGTYSAPIKFSVIIEPPMIAKKIAKDLESSGVALRWPASNGASGYRLVISKDPGFEPPLMEQKSKQPSLLLPLNQKGRYFIRVAALDENGAQISDFSSASTLEIGERSKLEPPIPKLPLEGISIVPMNNKGVPIVFKWKPGNGADNYLLEIANDSEFKETLLSQRTVETQYILNNTLPTGTIYWRVRSEKGTQFSPWSKTTTFEFSNRSGP